MDEQIGVSEVGVGMGFLLEAGFALNLHTCTQWGMCTHESHNSSWYV